MVGVEHERSQGAGHRRFVGRVSGRASLVRRAHQDDKDVTTT